MSLFAYNNLNVTQSANVMHSVWFTQNSGQHKDSIIDYSVPSNRLHKHIDGSIELEQKTLFEVVGERIVRPLLDKACDLSNRSFRVLKMGFSLIDTIFSKALSILPLVEASSTVTANNPSSGSSASVVPTSTLEKCVGPNLEQAYKVTAAAIANNNPKLLEAAHMLYGPFFENCFNDESFHKANEIYARDLKAHQEFRKKFEEKLKECETENGGTGYCKAKSKVDITPDIFQIDKTRTENGQTVTAQEWTTSPGYFSASIEIYKWYWSDGYYSSSSYNFDTDSKKRTVLNRAEIEENAK